MILSEAFRSIFTIYVSIHASESLHSHFEPSTITENFWKSEKYLIGKSALDFDWANPIEVKSSRSRSRIYTC